MCVLYVINQKFPYTGLFHILFVTNYWTINPEEFGGPTAIRQHELNTNVLTISA